MDSNPDYTQQNRRAWNEIASVRARIFPPAEFFARGGSTLNARVVDAARAAFGSDLSKLRLIHLQCATGEDTLSWAVQGAQACGVDIADAQVAIANQKAADANLPARFYAADVYALPGALPADAQGDYDIVFTGGGALVWLPDIRAWAGVVAGLLHPGGRLILEEEHPVSGIMWVEDGHIVIEYDYFSRGKADIDTGWAHFSGAEDAREIKYEFSWPLGDIITALAQAGLIIERLEEYPSTQAFRFGDNLAEAARLPGEYLLIARKP